MLKLTHKCRGSRVDPVSGGVMVVDYQTEGRSRGGGLIKLQE